MTKNEVQAEALEAIGDKLKAGVEISMGVGKTMLGLKHMTKYFTDIVSYLVVAPRKKIFNSWIDDANKYDLAFLLPHVEFTTYRSLIKHDPKAFDVIYLDECHSLKESHLTWLKEFEAQNGKIIGLTGTYPVKKYTEKGKMCNYFCPKVYEYNTDDAVSDDILNDYQILVHQLNLNQVLTINVKMKNGGTFKTSEFKNYNYWNSRLEKANPGREEQIARIQRMKTLQKMPSKEYYAKKLFDKQLEKVLVFANTKEQADRLCSNRVHSGIPEKLAKETLERFKKGEITKLSAVDQLSEGITIPNLKVGIIMHAYANNRKASQKIGRFLRLNPDEVATVHILCYMNTVDEDWVKSALAKFDQSKVKWIN